jgi:hypothetical protein
MYAYKEFKIYGICPYCNTEYETILNQIPASLVYQCSKCKRGLSMITSPNGYATVETGTPKQSLAVISNLSRGCCGHD